MAAQGLVRGRDVRTSIDIAASRPYVSAVEAVRPWRVDPEGRFILFKLRKPT